MKIVSDVYVHIYAGLNFNKESSLVFAQSDMSSYGYVLIGKTQIEIEIDLLNVRDAQITQLQEQIKKERAKTYVEVGKLEQQIQDLMCLENGLNEGDM
jgi:hypothetical protein